MTIYQGRFSLENFSPIPGLGGSTNYASKFYLNIREESFIVRVFGVLD